MTDTKKRMAGSRLIALWLISLALLAGACPSPWPRARTPSTTRPASSQSPRNRTSRRPSTRRRRRPGSPSTPSWCPTRGYPHAQDRQDLLTQEASEASVPQDAGVIMVAPKDRWDVAANLNGVSEDAVSNAMEPDFRDGNFASGLIAGADEIRGEPVAPQGNPETARAACLGGGLILLLLVGGAGTVALLRNRRARKRRIEQQRRIAEEEFAGLTTSLDEFDEKERLVSGYLEAQRPLLDQRTEEWVEARISDAKTAGFAQEFNEAASGLYLRSFPGAGADGARARSSRRGHGEPRRGREDHGRIQGRRRSTGRQAPCGGGGDPGGRTSRADSAVRRRRRRTSEAAPGIRPAGARGGGSRLPQGRVRSQADPRRPRGARQQAREYEEAVRDNISARDALPDERHATEGALVRARTALEEYRGAYERAVGEFGQAALGEVPNPGELSSGLLESDGAVERADRASSAGRFVEARSLLQAGRRPRRGDHAGPEPAQGGDRGGRPQEARRRGEAEELEARLAQAKANEHLMGPYQRQRLRDYEYQLQNARYGFFGETGSPPSCSSRRWITITCPWATLHPSTTPGAIGVAGTSAVAIGAAVIGVAATSAEGISSVSTSAGQP